MPSSLPSSSSSCMKVNGRAHSKWRQLCSVYMKNDDTSRLFRKTRSLIGQEFDSSVSELGVNVSHNCDLTSPASFPSFPTVVDVRFGSEKPLYAQSWTVMMATTTTMVSLSWLVIFFFGEKPSWREKLAPSGWQIFLGKLFPKPKSASRYASSWNNVPRWADKNR